MPQRKPTLVLGGTGKTGRRVVERLESHGRYRCASAPARASRRSTGRIMRRGRRRWDGAGSVYVSHYLDWLLSGAAETVGAFAEQAVASGAHAGRVPRPGRGENEAELVEQAVRDSGAQLTILRSTWFSQNFSETYFLRFRVGGARSGSRPATPREPFIDADDIADVAVAALTDDRHTAGLYELTGPRLLRLRGGGGRRSPRRPAARSATCRSPRRLFASEMAAQGVPADLVDLLTYLFSDMGP